MKLSDPISKIMKTDVVTLTPGDSMSDVADVFDRKHIHHIPISEGEKLVGLVSKSDFNFFRHDVTDKESADLEMKRLKSQEIGQLMHKNLKTLRPEDSVESALKIFRENYFHAIPISLEGQLKGILTPLDIIEHLI
jgi:CBS domain-containing protein